METYGGVSSNGMLNHLILKIVLGKVDEETLYSSRLVCTLWNQVATKLVIEKYPSTISLRGEKRSKWATEGPCFKKCWIESLPALWSILHKSDCHEILMTKCSIDGATDNVKLISLKPLEGQKVAMNLFSIILEDFGSCLCSLSIFNCRLSYALMQSILSKWCPCLEVLCLMGVVGCPVGGTLSIFEESEAGKEKTLKLKTLSSDLDQAEGYLGTVELLLSMMKVSPVLNNLNIMYLGYEFESCKEYFRRLKTLPQCTNRLEELSIDYFDVSKCDILEDLKELSLQNLKAFTLQKIDENGDAAPIAQPIVFELLRRYKDTLETLTIMALFPYKTVESDAVEEDWEIPFFPKLTTFKHMTYESYLLPSIDLLQQMPTLKRLTLCDGKNVWTHLSTGYTDSLFSSSTSREPHRSLEELIINGPIFCSVTTTNMSQALPNLSTLFVSFQADSCSVEWYNAAFEGLSTMKNLSDLTIDFDNCEDLTDELDVTQAFISLTTLPDLRYFTIINIFKDLVGPNFMNALEALLLGAINLRCLELVNVEVESVDLKKLTDCVESLSNRDWPLRLELSEEHPLEKLY